MSRPTAAQLGSWLALGIGSAMLLGIIAARLQLAGVAPIGVFSLATGAVLGAVLLSLAYACGMAEQKKLLAWVGVLALGAIAAEHGWLYRDYCRQWHEVRQQQPQLTLFRSEPAPKSILSYLADEASLPRIFLWLGDAALLTAAAVSIVAVGRPRTAGDTQSTGDA